MRRYLSIFILIITSSVTAQSFTAIDNKKNLNKYEGFFNFWYDQSSDKIYLQVDKLNQDFLYVQSLTSGLGSNDIGLDRGQLGKRAIVKFKRAGNKLLLIQPNQNYRATTDNELERRSVKQAFAKSVLFGFKILEKNDNGFLIDFTPFLMQDVHGVAMRLKQKKQGSYKLDETKSALAMKRTKAFPENTEFEALLTFSGEPKHRFIKSVAPDASKLTVIQHHSFVKLPDEDYEKRTFHPRSGANFISYKDYSTPINKPLTKRFIIRHLLEKKNPNSKISEAKEPIVYYLDRGAPEPVRSALLEGARWWNQAFEEIGYKNAFQVKMLPKDADPLDIRYNVIQWVHRSTRGWSYGASVVDPRTGEILKGHVSLGSLRIRQDFMIAQALSNKPFELSEDNYQEMLDMSLARIRQLSAHEVGHTLGFAHNFAASTDSRSSVMDYPHPLLEMDKDEIDFSNAYDVDIGEWDKLSVAYAYGDESKEQSEKEYLRSILKQARDDGLKFISDADARPTGGAHASAHLWDNGKNAFEELNHILKLRKTGISNFSIDNIKKGEPLSVLEDVFVPLYFLHRYQTEATVKLIGGLNYNYATKGSGLKPVESISKTDQKKAMRTVLQTLNAETLAIPENILKLFPPRAFGHPRNRESFKSNTSVTFDALGAPATASDMTLELLLHPERANRLIQQKSLSNKSLGLEEVLDNLIDKTIEKKYKSGYLSEVQNSINFNVLKHLMNLSANKKSIPQVKAIANAVLSDLKQNMTKKSSVIAKEFVNRIEKFEGQPEKFEIQPSLEIPDGSPIGSFQCLNH